MHLPSSIRGRLAVLVLTVLIPITCVSVAAAVKVYRDTQSAVSAVALETAKTLALVVDRELAVRVAVLKTLATSSALERKDFETFHREASKVVPSRENTIVLVDPTGQQLVNTRVPFGSKSLPKATNFDEIHGDKSFAVSDLYMAPVGKSHSFAVRVPVARGEEARWYVAMGSFASQLQKIYSQQTFPSTWVSTVLDAKGRVVARSKDAERYIGRSATDDMLEKVRTHEHGVHETHTLDGTPVVTAFSRVPGTGWTVLIGLPRAENQAAAWKAFGLVMGAAMAITVLCLGIAAVLARSMAEPVRRLEADAAALGRGDLVTYSPSGLAETDAVQRQLAAASKALREADEKTRAQVSSAVAETKRTQQAALAAQKLEALGRLTGSIAHDFNNLLQTMLTGLKLVERSCTDSMPQAAITTCQRAVKKAVQLTRQLMAFGRAQPGHQQLVDVRRNLEEMKDLMRGALPASAAFTLNVPDGLWHVRVDPVQLELAVLNLVLNARDALKATGRIEVSARNMTLCDNEVEGLPAGEYVAVSVRDDGEGIAPEVLPRVFEPFFTTKPQGKGTGLGLAQVYAFSRQHGGTALVESKVGEGTNITIVLPRTSEEMVQAEAELTSSRGVDKHHGTVLFVEDDSLVRGVVSQALEEAGFKVVVASNAEDALALARSRSDLDAVLTDVVMPGGQSGLDLAKTLRVLRPALPVVLASGYAEALQDGETEFAIVAKPYDPTLVAERLSLLIRDAGGR